MLTIKSTMNLTKIRSSLKIISDIHSFKTSQTRYLSVLSSIHYQQAIKINSTDAIKNDYHCTLEEWNNAKPFSEVPGPKPVPIIGNTWRFFPKIGEYSMIVSDIIGVFDKMYRQYGKTLKLVGVIGLQDSVCLFDPADIEMIYKLEGVMPERIIIPSGTYYRENYRQELFKNAKGLVMSQGKEWYDFRSKVNTIMMQPKMIKQYVQPVDTVAKEFIRRIKKIRGSNNKLELDLWEETNKWSLESIAYLALNTKLGCLADDLAEDSLPAKMIHITEQVFLYSGKLDFQPSIWKWVATPTFKKAMKAYDNQVEIGQYLIERAIEKINEKSRNVIDENGEEPSVLEKLLKIDKNVAFVMALDMLLAGVDTTSTAFINNLYYLSTNEDKQEKLRQEVLSILPDEDSEITVDILNSMPYLKACIKEAARIYPVTGGSMRILTKNAVVSGYQMPKGTSMMFLHMVISQNEENFIRPKEYLPERWLRENIGTDISYKNAHPFTAMHFGFGARSCIGRRFAELELEVAIIQFIRNFKISWDGPAPGRRTTTINYLLGPFNFVFKDLKT